jgi:hypothetical protein
MTQAFPACRFVFFDDFAILFMSLYIKLSKYCHSFALKIIHGMILRNEMPSGQWGLTLPHQNMALEKL